MVTAHAWVDVVFTAYTDSSVAVCRFTANLMPLDRDSASQGFSPLEAP